MNFCYFFFSSGLSNVWPEFEPVTVLFQEILINTGAVRWNKESTNVILHLCTWNSI